MKPLNSVLSTLLLATLLAGTALGQSPTGKNSPLLERANMAVARASAAFIENRGQWSSEARFLASMEGVNLWVTDRGFVYDLYRDAGSPDQRIAERGKATGGRSGHVVRMNFVDAARSVARGLEMLPTKHNYFIGNDPTRWAANVPTYGEARINQLYNGIDAAIYFDEGKPRYDLIVAPEADPSDIRISIEGATSLSVNRKGELVIGTSMGELRQQGLFAYQMIDGARKQVPCHFKVGRDNRIGFKLGAYDRSRQLVIDPLLLGTYISQSGYSRGFDVALDASANMYITGYTGFPSFPVSQGAYQSNLSGESIDAFVTKLDSNGNGILYSTYIGGTTDDVGTSLVVDGNGSIYLTGFTYSADFPTLNAFDDTHNGVRDIFVVKLDPFQDTPPAQLIYSTYVGGTDDDFGMGIAIKSGSAFVTGHSRSAAFPTVNGFQPNPALNGGQPSGDAVIFRLGPTGSALLASTFLGGTNRDVGYSIGLDNVGNVFVCGSTFSTDFPTNGASPSYDASHNGQSDAFVAKLDPGLATLQYASYLGGSGRDEARGIAVDGTGNAYITGMAAGGFPTTSGAFEDTYRGGDNDIFAAKMNVSGGLAYSTYIGGNNDEWGNDIAVDADGSAFVTGITRAQNFPVTTNALQPTLKGTDFDCFIVQVHPNGSTLSYASYLGGSSGDTATAIAVGPTGYVHVSGTTFSTNFPTTPGAYLRTGVGGVFLAKVGIMRMTGPAGGEIWCAGENITITWSGGDPNGAFDLYISADSGRTFTPIAFNVPGSSYSWFIPVSLQAGTEYRVRVIVSNGVEADLSNRITIITPPSITAQPASVTTSVGSTATFIATASGTPAPTIRWQVRSVDGWHDVPNQTGSTLRVTNVTPAQNGTYYRAVFTNSCRQVISDSALLTVPSILVTSPNGGEGFCAGSTVTITWTESPEGGAADIFITSDAGASWMRIANDVNGSSYSWTIPASLKGTLFLVRVQTGGGLPLDISDQFFTINQRAEVTKEPTDAAGQVGSNVTIVAEGSGTPAPTVKWEVNNGSGWIAVVGGTSASLRLQNLDLSQNGLRYRAIFANDCGSDTTQEVRLTVSDDPGGVDEGDASTGALRMTLLPNPVRGGAELRYHLPRTGRVELRIVDMAGRIVARPLDARMSSGDHTLRLDASLLPPGAYHCVLLFGGKQRSITMHVVR